MSEEKWAECAWLVTGTISRKVVRLLECDAHGEDSSCPSLWLRTRPRSSYLACDTLNKRAAGLRVLQSLKDRKQLCKIVSR